MAFNAGEENKGYTLYTGLADVQIVAINPTKNEAEKIGVNMKNDPIYISIDEVTGNRKARIDIYVKSESTKRVDKMAFFMEDVSKVSAAGNTQYINDHGTSCYAASLSEAVEKYTWFKNTGAKEAISGEVDLVDFIKNLLNIQNDAIAKLDNVKALFTGNVSELSELANRFSDRKVQVLYYVRESNDIWYQGIYSRYFSRAGNKSSKYWEKHFEKNSTKPNYQNSFVFQEFNPLSQNSNGSKSTEDAPPSIW